MVGFLLCLRLVLKDVLLRGLATILWAVTIILSLAIFFLCMLYGLNQGLMKTPWVEHKGERIKMEISQKLDKNGKRLKKKECFISKSVSFI